jgi:predicted ATPase/class 3 adenylate cyclase
MSTATGSDVHLPSGTVTFLFSDIEGSTRLWDSQPSLMEAALATHDEIVGTQVVSSGGIVLKHTGDGFFAVFDGPSEAVAAAAAITRALADRDWGRCPIRVRMGIHTGAALPRAGDYFGPTVHLAARVMDAANGGQVLLSDSATALACRSLPAGVTLADRGLHRLKDLGEPAHLWLVVIDGVATDERTLRTLDSMPNNLPVELSSFVGRHREMVELQEAIRDGRLVTLTGVGGVGKTRLALQVAAESLGDYSDGVWLVELASLSDPQFLVQTLLAALRLRNPIGGQDPLELLLAHLAHRQALIVLDNCEHLIDDAAKLVETVLAATRHVHILATSREPLALGGERRWRVPSLGVAADDDEAVALFVDRATSLVPDFEMTAECRTSVETICRHLDGIPLAIELAAARLTMLTPAQIAEQLDDRFRVLTGGRRTALGRQRTLAGMLDWSHDLLTEPERVLLRRLSVFSDGFDLESAEAICGTGVLSTSEVFDRLGRLVDESMVQFDREPGPRYRLLETVRLYANTKLVDAGEADETSARHADHFERVASTIDDLVEAGDMDGAHRIARLELANLRAAMTWSYRGDQPEQGLSIAVHLRDYFWHKHNYREALTWLERGLEVVAPTTSGLYVRALYYATTDAANMAALDLADALRSQAEDLLAQLDDPVMSADLNNAIANVIAETDPRRSLTHFATSGELYRSVGSPRWLRPEWNRIFPVSYTGDLSDVDAHIERVREADRSGIAPLFDVGLLEAWYRLVAGEPDAALAALAAGRPSPANEVYFRWARAESFRQLNRRDECERELADLRASYESIVDFADYPFVAITGAWLALDGGDHELALERWTPVSRRAQREGPSVWRAATATLHCVLAARRAEWDRAARLFGFADAESDRCSYRPFVHDRPRVEAARARSAEALGHDRFTEAHALGARAEYLELPLFSSLSIDAT